MSASQEFLNIRRITSAVESKEKKNAMILKKNRNLF